MEMNTYTMENSNSMNGLMIEMILFSMHKHMHQSHTLVR